MCSRAKAVVFCQSACWGWIGDRGSGGGLDCHDDGVGTQAHVDLGHVALELHVGLQRGPLQAANLMAAGAVRYLMEGP